jgi:hypothetical protein
MKVDELTQRLFDLADTAMKAGDLPTALECYREARMAKHPPAGAGWRGNKTSKEAKHIGRSLMNDEQRAKLAAAIAKNRGEPANGRDAEDEQFSED